MTPPLFRLTHTLIVDEKGRADEDLSCSRTATTVTGRVGARGGNRGSLPEAVLNALDSDAGVCGPAGGSSGAGLPGSTALRRICAAGSSTASIRLWSPSHRKPPSICAPAWKLLAQAGKEV